MTENESGICAGAEGSALAHTDERMVKAGLKTNEYACEARGGHWVPDDDQNLRAKEIPPVGKEFEANRQELSSNEQDFMRRYERQARFANNGVDSPDPASKQITPEIMEELDLNKETMHPVAQKAFNDVMGRPQAFNLQVEENNFIEQKLGQGAHDFTAATP